MKRTAVVSILLVGIIMLVPLIYLAAVYLRLPLTVPVHFDAEGNANGFAARSSLWIYVSLLTVLAAGMYLLVKNLSKIDPNKAAGQSPELLNKIAIVIVLILSAVNTMIVYAATGGPMKINRLLLPFMGFVFALLGNYMHSIKPNYFIGFRLPWTLADAENWRKTHQLVGRLWVPGGVMIMIGTLLLPAKEAYIFFLGLLFLMVVIPAGFSYRVFKKQNQS